MPSWASPSDASRRESRWSGHRHRIGIGISIDAVEAEGSPSPHFRVALEVSDTEQVTRRLTEAGAELVAEARVTQWNSLNSRLNAPADVQLTIFQELGSPTE